MVSRSVNRLLTTAIDLSGDRPRKRYGRCIPCYEYKSGGPYFAYPDIYMDVVEDAAKLFTLGLEAGGLTFQILMNRPFEELRRNCHQLVDDETLRWTVVLVQQHTRVLRIGNSVKLIGSPYLLEMGQRIWERAQSKAA